MKILQVTAPYRYEILEVPTPSPGAGEVLLRIAAVTTCPQWDLHLHHNEPMFVGHRFVYPYPPGQPGHEATGTIAAVGEGVEGLAPGDRVSAWRDSGAGCYAQYALHKAENVIRVPDDLPDDALAPVELAMCMGAVFRMLREMGAARGRAVGVSGLGPAGLVALQMARAEGAEAVIGLDPLPDRREMALKLGADACFDPLAAPALPPLQTAVDCVGAWASVSYLLDRVEDVVALFGVQREDYIFSPRHFGLRLCGYQGHSRPSAEYAVELIRAGKLDLAPLVTHHLPLERYGEAVELLETRQAIKVCLLPWE